MAFTSLSDSTRFNNLPVLLLGPILRRVISNVSTVFIVTKVPVSVELHIYDSNGNTIASSTSINSYQIGKHMHVCFPNVSSENIIFNFGNYYEYDIKFTTIDGVDKSSDPPTLLSTEISGPNGFSDYLYNGFSRPNFVFMPGEFSDIKVLHGSCRKPHGNWSDTLVAVDKIINQTKANNSDRPNILLMTGDQIYADDVADQLLFLIKDAGDKLFGIDEDIDFSDLMPELEDIKDNLKKTDILKTTTTQTYNTVFDNLNLFNGDYIQLKNLIPGIRAPFILASHLSVDSKDTNQKKYIFGKNKINIGKSHLASLSEYMLMYIFVWSDVLWPNHEDFPSFDDVYDSKVIKTIEDGQKNLTNKFLRTTYTTLRKGLRNIIGKDPALPDDSKYKVRFDNDEHSLKRFKDGLKQVRRALAHIPTLMMFDDHEITDDCFLNREWCVNTFISESPAPKDVYGNELKPTNLSKRVIANGLTALTIFQTFGNNDSEREKNQANLDGNKLLEYIDFQIKSISFDFDTLQNFILPKIVQSDLANYESSRLESEVKYSSSVIYSTTGNSIVLLNTRTTRSFPKDANQNIDYRGASGLTSDYEMNNYIGFMSGKSVILTTPSPVFGHSLIEPVFESIMRYSNDNTTNEIYDYEAWGYNKAARENLLNKLTGFDHVVILSGDVHYGFSFEGKYWNETDINNHKKYGLAQLTGSSIKNKDLLTKAVEKLPLLPMYHLNWTTEGKHVSNANIGEMISSWFTTNKKIIPNMDKMKVKHFEGVQSDIVNFTNNFWGSLWDKISNFKLIDPDLIKKFNYYMDFISRWSQTGEWLFKNYDKIMGMKDELIAYFDQLVIDYQFIKDNWYIDKTLVLNYQNYWKDSAYDFLDNHFEWIDENWDKINEYWQDIKDFITDPPDVEFVFPYNLYYKVNSRPETFYRLKSIVDERINRLEQEIWQHLNSVFDFGDNNGTPTEEKLFQKLSVSMIIKWDGFIGKEVVGTNNLSEVTFEYEETNPNVIQKFKVIQKFWAELLQIDYNAEKFIFFKPLPKVNEPDYHNTLKPWTIHIVDIMVPSGSDVPLIIPD